MKKLLIVLIGALAMACGDGTRSGQNETSGTNDDTETSGEVMESDTTGIRSDTASYQGTEGDALRTDTTTQAP